jgi:hypothetical protein
VLVLAGVEVDAGVDVEAGADTGAAAAGAAAGTTALVAITGAEYHKAESMNPVALPVHRVELVPLAC